MHVNRLYIRNFRSIKELDLVLHPGKNVIVGRNNCGKSNIMKALDIVMGDNSPDYARSENITLNDFHTYSEAAAGKKTTTTITSELFIWCEITRGEHEELNHAELSKVYGIYRCDRDNGGNPMRFDTLPESYDDAFLFEQDECEYKRYFSPRGKRPTAFFDELDYQFQFAIGFKANRIDGKIRKEARLFYRENAGQHWKMTFKASIRTELLQSAVIPSFRDPQQQLRLTAWSWYGRLIRHLTDGHASLGELNDAYGRVSDIANGIFEGVREAVGQSTVKIAFPGTEIYFQLSPDVQTELYKSCLIYVDDGFKSLLTDKGSGIQSATIIGLFSYYVNNVDTVNAALLCVEEPELYLHPHARRVMSRRLTEFIGSRNQVILTTHSSEFLRSEGEDVHVLSVKNDKVRGTSCSTINLKRFAELSVNQAANEVFFADSVIVCEGFDEYIIRAIAQSLRPGELDEQNVTVVSVGGKDAIAKMAKLILKLGTKCYIVADFDYLLRDRSEECQHYNAKPHESIESLGAAFFQQECTFGSRGTAALAALQRHRARLKKDKPEAFYKASTLAEVEDDKASNALEAMRKSGVLILPGQIEDLCIDGTFSRERKLSLAKIFELNHRISDGESITSIFRTDEFADFFTRVLGEPKPKDDDRSVAAGREIVNE